MKILTAREMRDIDRRCTDEYGILSIQLMENAGLQIAKAVEELFPHLRNTSVCIVAGTGNNGGDGFVAARHLKNRGAVVKVAYLPGGLSGDAAVNFAILEKMGVDLLPLDEDDLSPLANAVGAAHVIIDAIFGTGLARPVTGLAAAVISVVKRIGKPVVSVDIPSGIHADTGEVLGEAIRATRTVTLGFYKRGLLLYPGAVHAAEVTVADIGIPPELAAGCPVSYLTMESVPRLIARPKDAYKGVFGHLLVVAGSAGKAGAALMAARASLRIGTGLVSVAVPQSLNPVFETGLTEAMTVPLPETSEQTLSLKAKRRMMEVIKGVSAVVVGPGLGTNPETAQLVRGIVQHAEVPLVIDADGISAVASNPEVLTMAKAPLVLTPHPGEMGRLVGMTPSEVQKNRFAIAEQFAREYNVVLVLKGAGTIVACPEGEMFVNSTGNPGMATAGTGDVLSGMIAGLLAQGMDAAQAASAGVFLHGMAGDLAASEIGEAGLIATDIIARIPGAMQCIRSKEGDGECLP